MLARIDRLNPSLHAYLVRFDDLTRRQAREAEAAYRAGRALPLSGVPISIKDTYPLAGAVTTFGSVVHRHNLHAAGQRGCSPAESLGRRVHWQDQHRRIRPVGDQRQPPWAGGLQPVGYHAHAGRLERRRGGFGRGRTCQRRACRRRRRGRSAFRHRSPDCSDSNPPTAFAPTKAACRRCRISFAQVHWRGARPMRGRSWVRFSVAG